MLEIKQDTSKRMLQDVDPEGKNVNALRGHSVGIKVWVLHRITGVGLLLYLLAHIATMSTAMFLGEEAFKRSFDILFKTPIFIFFDVLVLAALIIHALNGMRLIIMEMGYFIVKQKQKILLIITFTGASILFLWLFFRAFV
jgi:succinate dehydrogenase / fumarate reductase cytochrome b subunit